MKKLLLVSAVLLGAISASQAGVRLNIGLSLPVPPLPGLVFCPPTPVVVAPVPQPYCAPPVVSYGYGCYGYGYAPRYYGHANWDHHRGYRDSRGWDHDRGGHRR